MIEPIDIAVSRTLAAQLQRVGKTYRQGKVCVDALRDITLEIPSRSFCCVLGSSGAGKTTLLNLLGLMDLPTEGTLRVADETLFESGKVKVSAGRRDQFRRMHIGMIFTDFFLLPTLTAWENVQLPLLWSERREANYARELLVRVGLEHRMSHRPAELSGGEMQRVAIARALIHRPQLLLADEPTGNVDTYTRDTIFALFRELHDDGLTIVMATHDHELARQLDHVVHLQDGRIL
jgi:ABC-type lipoprotein export system ATPase subunit